MNLFGTRDSIVSFEGPIVLGVQPITLQGQEVEGFVHAVDFFKGYIDIRLAFRKNGIIDAPLATLFKKNTLTEDIDEIYELIESMMKNHKDELKELVDEEIIEEIEHIQTEIGYIHDELITGGK